MRLERTTYAWATHTELIDVYFSDDIMRARAQIFDTYDYSHRRLGDDRAITTIFIPSEKIPFALRSVLSRDIELTIAGVARHNHIGFEFQAVKGAPVEGRVLIEMSPANEPRPGLQILGMKEQTAGQITSRIESENAELTHTDTELHSATVSDNALTPACSSLTELRITVDYSLTIPFIGQRLEKLGSPLVERFLAGDLATIDEILKLKREAKK